MFHCHDENFRRVCTASELSPNLLRRCYLLEYLVVWRYPIRLVYARAARWFAIPTGYGNTWFPSLWFFWEVGSWYFNMKQFIQIVSGFKLFSRVQPCLGWFEATHFFSGLKTTNQTCSVRRLLTSFWVMFRKWNDSKWTSFPHLIQEKMLRHDVFRPCKTGLDGNRDGCFAARLRSLG